MVNRLADSAGKPTPPAKPLNPIFNYNQTQAPKPPLLAAQNAPAASQASPIPSGGGGGGSYGGGGYAAAAAPVAAAPAAPAPVKDIDWFNQDSVYRGAAGRSLADLTGQLAQILAQRDSSYQQLDNNRADVAHQRQDDLTNVGQDFASRGLAGSGLYADFADQTAADYARQNSALDQGAAQLAQQYGKRDNMVNLSGVNGNNGMADLSGIYGLLGSLGLAAGNNYNQAIGKAKADSAARSTAPLLQTTTW